MSDVITRGRELTADELIHGHYQPPRRAVWCDNTGRILFHTDQRVTVPNAGNLHGVIVDFDEDGYQIGVLPDNDDHVIYFDADTVKGLDGSGHDTRRNPYTHSHFVTDDWVLPPTVTSSFEGNGVDWLTANTLANLALNRIQLAKAEIGLRDYRRTISDLRRALDIQHKTLALRGVNVTSTPLSTLKLSVRVYNAIVRSYGALDCESLAYLVFGCPSDVLLSVRAFGDKSLIECRDKLTEHGFNELCKPLQGVTPQAPLTLGVFTFSYIVTDSEANNGN